jgi:hypothetical protein
MLDLPKLHVLVFHVSWLKKAVCAMTQVAPALLYELFALQVLERILQHRKVVRRVSTVL